MIITVKGDVHDIGKNIVAAVVKSAGYQVIDMERDVPTERIIGVVKKEWPRDYGFPVDFLYYPRYWENHVFEMV